MPLRNARPTSPHGKLGGAGQPGGGAAGPRVCTQNWACFWVMGMANNLPFVVVLSGAQKVANKYNQSHLMPLMLWALVAFGLAVATVNTVVFAGKEYWWRFGLVANGTVVGLTMVALSPWVGSTGLAHFVFALAGVCTLGAACSFGESVALGYMHSFPEGMVGGWSSGTGMSGVLGTLVFLGLSNAGLGISAIFVATTGFVALYAAAYLFITEPAA
eukprot:gene18548-20120_t